MATDSNFSDPTDGGEIGGTAKRVLAEREADRRSTLLDRTVRTTHSHAEVLEGLRRETITDYYGVQWDTLASRLGSDPDALAGFTVYRVADGGPRVSPSLVSGMGATPAIPTMGGTSLANDPPPTMQVPGAGAWIAIELEVEPASRMALPLGPGSMPEYVIAEGMGKLLRAEVRSYTGLGAVNSAAKLPTVDPKTGNPKQNGVYIVPLALVGAGGTVRQIGYIGPLGVVMCASGALVVSSPWRAVPSQPTA